MHRRRLIQSGLYCSRADRPRVKGTKQGDMWAGERSTGTIYGQCRGKEDAGGKSGLRGEVALTKWPPLGIGGHKTSSCAGGWWWVMSLHSNVGPATEAGP